MPVNKNALIRYRTIDRCLMNRQRKWSLNDLIDACCEALYEYEGKRDLSKRTIQLDIQNMRSGKLGYEAPIIVLENKFYTYEDPDFSITNIPISKGELDQLNEVVLLLKQFAGFSHFEEIDTMVKKLEDKIEVAKSERKPIIHIDQNHALKGLEYLDVLYKHIQNKEVLAVKYKAFHRLEKSDIILHPYFLKEYNNRWYLIGFSDFKRNIISLALDRMSGVSISDKVSFMKNNFFNPDAYFKDVIGMTVNIDAEPTEILLYVDGVMSPYVLTKPLHVSQKVIWSNGKSNVISIMVRINFELKERIRSFGKHLMVMRPLRLRNWFEKDIEASNALYNNKELRASIWKQLKRKK